MANAHSIILHHYESSPFSEKIRLALRLKNLAWTSVEIPNMMPKPDLLPLTGGYRRTPIMQIGADIYCDTALILRELEQRFSMQTLNLPGHEGLSSMVAAWTDGRWFQASVGIVFAAIGDGLPDDFKKDREAMSGRLFDAETLAATAPMLKDQWRAQLMWLEERLEGGRGAGSGDWLISTKPGIVDVHAHMNVWFVNMLARDFAEDCLSHAPLTRAWFQRLNEIEGQVPETIDSKAALEIAKQTAPRLVAATASYEPQEFGPGETVMVAPDDYAKDWVTGDLVHADAQRIILRRTSDACETMHVHFPRCGYIAKRA
ncbi:MAG: glutathione S-transferase [Hyphomonadaceae bacterium]